MKDQHNEPATQVDIAELRLDIERLDQRVERVEKHVVQLSQGIETFKDEAAALHEETRRHFDVVAEKFFHDAIGAHKDEIESLKDGKADHEWRIRRLEKSAGLVAA
jgi:predicted RNase H-like nuclease (RuvC/YqgF family)